MVGSLGPSLQRRNSSAAHKRAAAIAQARKGGSIAFNGSSYLTLPTNDVDLQVGIGDFTFQAWIKVSSLAANQTILDYRPAGVNGTYLTMYVNTSGKLVFFTNGSATINGSITVSTNTWTHVAWSRNSSTIRQFVGGQLDTGATYANSINYAAGSLSIGINSNTPGQYFNGNITDFQVIKGTGLYPSSGFGLPNAPAVTTSNTKLLLDAMTSATALTDISGLNKTVTNHGTTWSSDEPF